MNHTLKALWGQVLDIQVNHIDDDDGFFEVGGNSINAVRLVEAAEQAGYCLNVADIYRHPELSQMSTMLRLGDKSNSKDSGPAMFELVPDVAPLEGILSLVRDNILGSDAESVEDVYPCTPLQEGLMAISMKHHGSYVSQFVFQLPSDLNVPRLKDAWDKVIAHSDVLRTRIVHLDDPSGLFQVVMAHPIEWGGGSHLRTYLATDQAMPMGLGDCLMRLALIYESEDDRYLVWTIHHAIYDRWSIALILDQVAMVYQGTEQRDITPPKFSGFIRNLMSTSTEGCKQFWQAQLSGIHPRQFPKVPTPSYQPQTSALFQHSADITRPNASGITMSTVIQAAWALTVSTHSDSKDVVFGTTLMGRDTPVSGVARMHGPTMATVPVAIHLNDEATTLAFLEGVQTRMNDIIAFEHFGTQRISALNSESRSACQFQNILVIQPPADESNALRWKKIHFQKPTLFNYGLAIECEFSPDMSALHIRVDYDPHMITAAEVETLVYHFEQAISKLNQHHPDLKLGEVSLFGSYDLAKVLEWNQPDVVPVHECVHDIIHRRCLLQASEQAVTAWDGSFTYGELDSLSSLLATHLVHLGVRPEVFVPLCLEKSKWTPVAVVGVLKAGGAFVLLEPASPENRLRDMCRSVDASIVISSACHADLGKRLAATAVVVGDGTVPWLHANHASCVPPTCRPDHAAYAVFTSGSTGRPKGVIIEHCSFVTSANYHAPALQIRKESRVLHFSSYAFDISILEILTTLITGACICVPSDLDRGADLSGAITRLNSNWALLTPSVSRLLDPESVQGLETLCSAGEACTPSDILKWKEHLRFINAYGPAECSVISIVHPSFSGPEDFANVGHPTGVHPWVVDQNSHDRLLPIGMVGELVLEGPIVGREYIGDKEKTAAAFIEPPLWLKQIRPGVKPMPCYKTGDLVWLGEDGSVHFVGRKDRQVKLRGQRMELSEVEHHVEACFAGAQQVVAEIVKPLASERPPLLVAFIQQQVGLCRDHELILPVKEEFRSATQAAVSKLQHILPSFMIPTAFYPISKFPLTATGKLDREKLRNQAASLPWNELTAYTTGPRTVRMPSTALECRLQNLWAATLGLDPRVIGLDDDFFHLGGDSLSTMRLVSLARSEGLQLIVPDIFEHRQLHQLSSTLVVLEETDLTHHTEPFSLMGPQFHLDELAPAPATSGGAIVDVVPLNAAQLHSLSVMSLVQFVFSLRGDVSPDRLRRACHAVLQKHSILRTVFCRHRGTPVQAILQTDSCAFEHIVVEQDLTSALQSYDNPQVEESQVSGKPLVKFTMMSRYPLEHVFVIRLSHAQYDGLSLSIIFQDISSAYNRYSSLPSPAPAAYADYIYHQKRQPLQGVSEFWKHYLDGASMTCLPCQMSPSATPEVFTKGHATLDLPVPPAPATYAFLVNAAFVATLQSLTACHDLVYSLVRNTRDIPFPGAEGIVGPCLANGPIRVSLRAPEKTTVSQLIRAVQDQYVATTRFGANLVMSEIADIMGWPWGKNAGFFATSHVNMQSMQDALALEGVTATQLPPQMRVQPECRVFIYSVATAGSLQINVFTSSRTMQDNDADALAASLARTVDRFLKFPDAMVSSLVE